MKSLVHLVLVSIPLFFFQNIYSYSQSSSTGSIKIYSLDENSEKLSIEDIKKINNNFKVHLKDHQNTIIKTMLVPIKDLIKISLGSTKLAYS